MVVLLLLIFNILTLAFILPGCGGKKARESEKSTMREGTEAMSKMSGTNTIQKKPQTSAGSRSQVNSKEKKEGKKVVAETQNNVKPPSVEAVPTVPETKKSSKSKKQTSQKKQVAPAPEAPQQASGGKDSDVNTEGPAFPGAKVCSEPNDFEKAAAADGLVVDPTKVKRMGVIDDIVEQRREEQMKELENMKTTSTKDSGKGGGKGGKEMEKKRVKIVEDRCVMFETNDAPTPDDGDDENGEDPI